MRAVIFLFYQESHIKPFLHLFDEMVAQGYDCTLYTMNDLISRLKSELGCRNLSFYKFVDISTICFDALADQYSLHLPWNSSKPPNAAIIFGIALSKKFVTEAINSQRPDHDHFSDTEHRTDQYADEIADFIKDMGFRAYSMSENALKRTLSYDEARYISLLPHKTIACLAGIGWIGKNGLLITENFGCALSICTVLTDIPLPTEQTKQMLPQCGTCNQCKTICPTSTIHGTTWEMGILRESLLDVFQCETCLKCMTICPWTIRYAM